MSDAATTFETHDCKTSELRGEDKIEALISGSSGFYLMSDPQHRLVRFLKKMHVFIDTTRGKQSL